MRHKLKIKKMSLPTDQRIALLRSLAIALIKNEKIQTTYLRAKQASRFVDQLITIARDGTLASRRKVLRNVPDQSSMKKLFDENFIGRFKTQDKGGYTRVLKAGIRRGDNARMAVLEFTK